MGRLFITGDKHGQIDSIVDFVQKAETTLDDVLVILGDAGINYYQNDRDMRIKKRLSKLPLTIVCIHGNHEIRPQNISSYHFQTMNNNILAGGFFVEDDYPNLLFAHRTVFWFYNKRCLVCDGAYSVDKHYRLESGYAWWPDEQMTEQDKSFIRSILSLDNNFDFVFSHAAPYSQEPRHLFLGMVDQATVDINTPLFLDEVYDSINREYLTQWYFGHYHSDEKLPDKFTILFNSFVQVV